MSADDNTLPITARNMYDTFPTELVPLFRTSKANQSVEVFNEEMSLIENGKVLFSGPGTISLEWLPQPGYRFRLKYRIDNLAKWLGEHFGDKIPGECELDLLSSKRKFQALVGRRVTDESGVELRGWVFETSLPNNMLLREVFFHLPNFEAPYGTFIRDAEASGVRAARSEFEGEGWRITLDAIKDRSGSDSLLNQLRDLGGYGVTHVGRIARVDGASFGTEECCKLLDDLSWFFSFCQGFRTGPILIKAINHDGTEAGLCLKCPILNSWESRQRWVDDTRSDVFASVFPGYMRRVNDPLWGDPTRNAIHWHMEVHASSGGAEGAIIFAQAAMEMLGWTLLVDDLATVSRDGYDRLPASDKIRLLITTCDIPKDISAKFIDLSTAAKAETWQDGPDAISGIRNTVIHLNAKKRAALNRLEVRAIADTLWLSLSYLELLLLWLFDYNGRYVNRTGTGEWRSQNTELVPWATSQRRAGTAPTKT